MFTCSIFSLYLPPTKTLFHSLLHFSQAFSFNRFHSHFVFLYVPNFYFSTCNTRTSLVYTFLSSAFTALAFNWHSPLSQPRYPTIHHCLNLVTLPFTSLLNWHILRTQPQLFWPFVSAINPVRSLFFNLSLL